MTRRAKFGLLILSAAILVGMSLVNSGGQTYAFSTVDEHREICPNGRCEPPIPEEHEHDEHACGFFIGCRPSAGECAHSCPTGRARKVIFNSPKCANDPDPHACYC